MRAQPQKICLKTMRLCSGGRTSASATELAEGADAKIAEGRPVFANLAEELLT
jgi:hypothetical protein